MSKNLTGIVSSEKASKTIVVSVATRKTHPLYKKQYTETKKFMAHDGAEEAHVGDKVIIVECRPISARKRFKLERIVERAPIRHIETEAPLFTNEVPADKKPVAVKEKPQPTNDTKVESS